MNYQEQQKMRERMVELRKEMAALQEQFRTLLERVVALEATRTLRLPKK